MKKRSFLLVFNVFILLILTSVFFFTLDRYKISEPMRDLNYKKSIIKDSHNIFYKLERLRPIVGEEELTEFIKQNNNKPEIYSPTKENIEKGIFRANLHMHTLNSDGKATVQERLDEAQNYAQNNIKNGYMYIAITDHNTILGAKEVVKILQKNPNKYKNIKIILGMEVFSAYKTKYYRKPIDIHVLCWCINPYDKFLNKEFYKADKKDKYNRPKPDRKFQKVISMMNKYSIPGIAHPARYSTRIGKKKLLYIDDMLNQYKKISSKPLFLEGYYQTYPKYYSKEEMEKMLLPYVKEINKKADNLGIMKTGSTDSHSKTIFSW